MRQPVSRPMEAPPWKIGVDVEFMPSAARWIADAAGTGARHGTCPRLRLLLAHPIVLFIMRADTGLVLKVVTFAAEKHRNQRRKDPDASPYINHPIALANVLLHEAGVTDVVVLCAALLHDTLEDTQTTPEELARHFGTEIQGIVMEVTDNKKLK